MRLIWDKDALRKVDQTAQYIEARDGAQAAADFLEEVVQITHLLPVLPYIGPMERLLYRSKYKFRSLVVGKYNKVIYVVRDEEIVIVDFGDTRMNPKSLVKLLLKK